jgi:hypothetical protein
MVERARQAAPAGAAGLHMQLEDWILAVVLCLFPILGPVIGRGDGLSMAGVGILIWVGHRAPVSASLCDAHRALGISVALTLLCLYLPQLAPQSLAHGIRLGLLAALLCAFCRRPSPSRARLRRADLVVLGSLLGAGGLALGLWGLDEAGAARALAEVGLLLGIVYGIYRMHLLQSSALPVLTRATLLGVTGALVIVVLR